VIGGSRNQAQKAQWERDKRVLVTLRPLKYEYQRTFDGRPATDVDGRKIVIGSPREKCVDVLCALAVVREAQDPSTDLVVLASSDSDLAPAIDEVRLLGTAKIETFCWWDTEAKRGYQLHPTDRSRPVWQHETARVGIHRVAGPDQLPLRSGRTADLCAGTDSVSIPQASSVTLVVR
jgi:hypothetical protein